MRVELTLGLSINGSWINWWDWGGSVLSDGEASHDGGEGDSLELHVYEVGWR